MAIPQVIFASCPGCGEALELGVMGWRMALAEREESEGGGHGIVLELAAFVGHICWYEERS